MPTNGKSASGSRDFREAEQISKEWISIPSISAERGSKGYSSLAHVCLLADNSGLFSPNNRSGVYSATIAARTGDDCQRQETAVEETFMCFPCFLC